MTSKAAFKWVEGLAAILLYLGIPTVLALLLPGGWGVATVVATSVILLLAILIADEEDKYSRRHALMNIVGALAVTALIVLGGSLLAP